MRLVQWLTVINSKSPEAALLLMCVARQQMVLKLDRASA
jgi:hypothetical protein